MEKGEFCVGNSKDRAEKSRGAALRSLLQGQEASIPGRASQLIQEKGRQSGTLPLKQTDVASGYAGPDSQALQGLCKDAILHKHTVTVP